MTSKEVLVGGLYRIPKMNFLLFYIFGTMEPKIMKFMIRNFFQIKAGCSTQKSVRD